MQICYDHAFLEIRSHCYYTIRPLKHLNIHAEQYILANKVQDESYFEPTLAAAKTLLLKAK